MAKQTGLSTPQLLDRIIESERRRLIFDQADAAYAALQADPEAWEAELSERRLWDTTLADGLEMDTLYEPAAAPAAEQGRS
ncbi:MAG: toxin-antitoxin system protein [Thermomicrobiales bacterium]